MSRITKQVLSELLWHHHAFVLCPQSIVVTWISFGVLSHLFHVFSWIAKDVQDPMTSWQVSSELLWHHHAFVLCPQFYSLAQCIVVSSISFRVVTHLCSIDIYVLSENLAFLTKKYRKAVRWCARLNRSLNWLIRLICFLNFWIEWIELMYLIDWLNDSNVSLLWALWDN